MKNEIKQLQLKECQILFDVMNELVFILLHNNSFIVVLFKRSINTSFQTTTEDDVRLIYSDYLFFFLHNLSILQTLNHVEHHSFKEIEYCCKWYNIIFLSYCSNIVYSMLISLHHFKTLKWIHYPILHCSVVKRTIIIVIVFW